MRIFLLGKRASVTGWLEEATAAFRAEGHTAEVGIVRDPRLAAPLQAALAQPIAARIAARARRFAPDLILTVGGFHVPGDILERLAAWPNRPPLVGWVGDAFDATAASAAARYDLIAYTDSGLLARHRELGFTARAVFAPHAIDPATAVPVRERRMRMVFVANPTPDRLATASAIRSPVVLHGPGWPRIAPHEVHARRVPHGDLAGLYAGHLASLNVRNEFNVLTGLNQRHFQPPLGGAPLVSDAQPDLELCFEPGREVFVWRDFDELNAIHERILAEPAAALAVGEAARQRVLAEHSFGHRLEAIRQAI
ncbi:MAG TPA: glycosyltransferase [Caulobacteraceae bacterium]|jgi:spore maturation protein CgeB